MNKKAESSTSKKVEAERAACAKLLKNCAESAWREGVADERERCLSVCLAAIRAMPQPTVNWGDAQIIRALEQVADKIRSGEPA
jgi:hypothetical protein